MMTGRDPRPASTQDRRQRAVASRFVAAGRDRAAGVARRGTFSAELSPAELGLCADLGMRPLVQVMGASVYRVGVSGAPVLGDPGYREYFARGRRSGPVMFELRRLSSAYNDVRRDAVTRLRDQAAHAGAELVVGVELSLTEREVGDDRSLECVATGTAMRLPHSAGTLSPAVCPLSLTECWVLRQAGYDAIGLAATTAVYYARPSPATSRALGRRRLAAAPNQEFSDLSLAVTSAREVCQARLAAQATEQGGGGLIAVSLDLTHSLGVGLKEQDTGARRTRYANLHLTVHGLGTVIQPVDPATRHRRPAVPILSLT